MSIKISNSDAPLSAETSLGVPSGGSTQLGSGEGADFASGDVATHVTTAFNHDLTVTGVQQNDNAEYFARPRLILTYQWVAGTLTNQGVNPFSAFFAGLEMSNRYQFLNLFKGDMVIRFIINGTPFCYGLDVAAWFPRYGLNDGDIGAQTNVVQCIQRHSVELDPSSVNSQDLRIPFVNEDPFTGLSGQYPSAFQNLGVLTIQGLQTVFSTATSSPAPLTVSVYAWLESTEIGGPTPQLYAPSAPKGKSKAWAMVEKVAGSSKEDGRGPVSAVASAVATAAGSLRGVPFLGEGAMA